MNNWEVDALIARIRAVRKENQMMLDHWLEGEQCDVCGGDASECECYGDTLENSCSECGRRFVEELDGGFTCPKCDAKEEPDRD